MRLKNWTSFILCFKHLIFRRVRFCSFSICIMNQTTESSTPPSRVHMQLRHTEAELIKLGTPPSNIDRMAVGMMLYASLVVPQEHCSRIVDEAIDECIRDLLIPKIDELLESMATEYMLDAKAFENRKTHVSTSIRQAFFFDAAMRFGQLVEQNLAHIYQAIQITITGPEGPMLLKRFPCLVGEFMTVLRSNATERVSALYAAVTPELFLGMGNNITQTPVNHRGKALANVHCMLLGLLFRYIITPAILSLRGLKPVCWPLVEAKAWADRRIELTRERDRLAELMMVADHVCKLGSNGN